VFLSLPWRTSPVSLSLFSLWVHHLSGLSMKIPMNLHLLRWEVRRVSAEAGRPVRQRHRAGTLTYFFNFFFVFPLLQLLFSSILSLKFPETKHNFIDREKRKKKRKLPLVFDEWFGLATELLVRTGYVLLYVSVLVMLTLVVVWLDSAEWCWNRWIGSVWMFWIVVRTWLSGSFSVWLAFVIYS